MKKAIILLCCIVLIGSLFGCGPAKEKDSPGNTDSLESVAPGGSGEVVQISYYSTQAGVDNETMALLDEFMLENPDIKVEYIPCGDAQLQTWLSLYAANKAPTVTLADTTIVQTYSEYLYNFSENEISWLDNVLSGQEYYTVDGALYGIPSSIQGFGLIYNKRVIDEVMGKGFDLTTINTRDKLEELFIAIEESGLAAPAMLHGADWSLGAHFMGLLYTQYQGDKEAQLDFVEALRAGEISLMENDAFNDLIDTFDLLIKYNYNRSDPLRLNLESDCAAIATGKAATFFQGDWNWLFIGAVEGGDSELGIMPLPISNDPKSVTNTYLPASSPKGYCIDVEQNTPAQQEAGIRLVEWLCFSPQNQEFMGLMLGSTLPFSEVRFETVNPLAKSTQEYMEMNQILDISTLTIEVPVDYWYITGPYVQQYVAGEINRSQLAQLLETYWKAV